MHCGGRLLYIYRNCLGTFEKTWESVNYWNLIAVFCPMLLQKGQYKPHCTALSEVPTGQVYLEMYVMLWLHILKIDFVR